MKLYEHPDFEQAILNAAEHFAARGIRAPLIEKDYYVTEALRAIANAHGDHVIFKGGTSLSKGWELIDRFSEDIDLFLDPTSYEPPLGSKRKNRQLKTLRDCVLEHVPLTHLADDSQTIKDLGRNDWFSFEQKFGGPGEVAGRILLESGVASGSEPVEVVNLHSYLGQFLNEAGISLETDCEESFPMRLLHFRRTFVEKLFAIHKKIELFKQDGTPIGPHARHYYDLYQLGQRQEVIDMLKSPEYAEIKADYEVVSKKFFPNHYFAPEGMSFANSDAMFPPKELSEIIGPQYEQQCQALCYGPFPTWDEVLACFENMRSLL